MGEQAGTPATQRGYNEGDRLTATPKATSNSWNHRQYRGHSRALRSKQHQVDFRLRDSRVWPQPRVKYPAHVTLAFRDSLLGNLPLTPQRLWTWG